MDIKVNDINNKVDSHKDTMMMTISLMAYKMRNVGAINHREIDFDNMWNDLKKEDRNNKIDDILDNDGK